MHTPSRVVCPPEQQQKESVRARERGRERKQKPIEEHQTKSYAVWRAPRVIHTASCNMSFTRAKDENHAKVSDPPSASYDISLQKRQKYSCNRNDM